VLFNSLDFAIFLPCVFIIHWVIAAKMPSLQNVFLIISSYIFYAFWDWRFLALILISTITDFNVGLWISKTTKNRNKLLFLWLSVIVNLSILGFFKYFDFFQEAFIQVFHFFGNSLSASNLNVVLPIGISFYTFQTLSYAIDVYYEKIEPTSNFITYAAFVSFFPQLLAGPIERAGKMLPQFEQKRKFDYSKAVNGCKQILWGLFKKIVIADNASAIVNDIFGHYSSYNSSTLLLGIVLYTFQIYCDFSGYSDIAVGTSKLLGFDLSQNFLFPYFSRNITEFWRRWHISLTSWLNEYVFIPLAFTMRNFKQWGAFLAVLITFVISGIWHGAQGHFIVWGAFLGFMFLPIIFFSGVQSPFAKVYSKTVQLNELHHVLLTFVLICFAALLFRVESTDQAFHIVQRMVNPKFWGWPEVRPTDFILLTILFIIVEWNGRDSAFGIENWGKQYPKWVKTSFYYILIIMIIWWGGNEQSFIYFQF